MSNISGVGSSYSYVGGLVSGQVNSSQNPAGVTIDENAKSQINGTNRGAKNAEEGQSALKVADGALSGIADMLQRMRDLAVQASNSAVTTDDDRRAMQAEVDQLKKGIADSTKNTEFNTKKLLDGSMADMNLATNPDGTGMSIQFESTALKSLGIEDFDVTKDFDMKSIDDALEKVNKSRSSLGAQSNALNSKIAYNNIASENMTNFSSQIEDVDTQKFVSDRNKKHLLDLYSMYAQKMDMHSQESFINKMFGK